MHFPPLTGATYSSPPHSTFPFPSLHNSINSLSYLSQKPNKFIIYLSGNHTTPFKNPLNHASHFKIRDGFYPIEQKISSVALEEDENSNKISLDKETCKFHVQDLTNRVKDWNFDSISEFNDLFMGLVLADEVELAYKLYSGLSLHDFPADSLTFSILIHCHCKRNEPVEAKTVLKHMIENGFEPPKVRTFNQLINSFCKKGKLKQAFEVFGIMGMVKCEPTINTYNCLLKGLCYVGRVEEAYELLSKIKKSWKNPWKLKKSKFKKSWGVDIYSYTIVMDGLCKVGRSNEALELLDEAIAMGITPTIVTYNTLFNGYFKEGRPMEGFVLLKKMKENNCFPDNISYSTLLHGLLQWGEIGAGVRVYNEMLEMGFEVDERMVNTLLRGLCRKSRKEKEWLKDAYQLFDEMCKRGCGVDPCAYELMIEAYCNGKEMDKAFVNLCEMIRIGLFPRTFTLNVVIKGLCDEGKIEKAFFILVSVVTARCGMPERFAFDVLIKEMNRQDLAVGASCVYCVALKNGTIPLRKPR